MKSMIFLQKRFHDFSLIGARLISDQEERALDIAQKVPQPNQQFPGA
jgi:hypothetical protein